MARERYIHTRLRSTQAYSGKRKLVKCADMGPIRSISHDDYFVIASFYSNRTLRQYQLPKAVIIARISSLAKNLSKRAFSHSKSYPGGEKWQKCLITPLFLAEPPAGVTPSTRKKLRAGGVPLAAISQLSW